MNPTERRIIRFFLVVAILIVIIGLFLMMVKLASAADTAANQPDNLAVKQHRNDACLLAATATHLNYAEGARLYTSESFELAYRAKYNSSDWAKDADTSHNAQWLVQYVGYNPNAEQMPDVYRLKWRVWLGQHPIVFTAGGNSGMQHAVVIVKLLSDDTTVVVADPADGQLHNRNVHELWANLEPNHWVFWSTKSSASFT